MRTDYFGPFVQDKLDAMTNMVAWKKKTVPEDTCLNCRIYLCYLLLLCLVSKHIVFQKARIRYLRGENCQEWVRGVAVGTRGHSKLQQFPFSKYLERNFVCWEHGPAPLTVWRSFSCSWSFAGSRPSSTSYSGSNICFTSLWVYGTWE